MKRYFYSLATATILILALAGAFGAPAWVAAQGPGSQAPVPPPLATTPPSPVATPIPSPSPAACAFAFGDVQAADYYYAAVQYLACHAVVSGYTCGGPGEPCNSNFDPYFRPAAGTTRSQLTKLVTSGMGWPVVTPATPTFADVPAGHPFYAFVETAAAHGLISGYTCGGPGEPCDAQGRPYFRPYALVTRGQLSKIIAGAMGWLGSGPPVGTFADVAPGSAFFDAVETAAAHGLVSGYACGGPGEPCDAQSRPYFRAGNDATRGQFSKILYNALSRP